MTDDRQDLPLILNEFGSGLGGLRRACGASSSTVSGYGHARKHRYEDRDPRVSFRKLRYRLKNLLALQIFLILLDAFCSH